MYESVDVVQHGNNFAVDGGWYGVMDCGMTLALLDQEICSSLRIRNHIATRSLDTGKAAPG